MTPNKKITINEIARLAQVSKGTVSKVLNGKPGIGKDTRRRVMDLVEHLDYHPSFMAQALSYQRTNNIGLIIPYEAGNSLKGAYWSSIITAIAKKAAEDDYNLMLFTPQEEDDLGGVYDAVLRGRRVDGLIIGSEAINRARLTQVYTAGIPFILIGQNPEFRHHYVDIDNSFAIRSMTEYILDQGYPYLTYLSGPTRYYYNRERLASYQETMRQRNLEPRFAVATEYDTKHVQESVDLLLDGEPAPKALFIGAGGDFLYDVIMRLKARGLDIHAMGLGVFDDDKYLDLMEVKITAVKQPLDELGSVVTSSLLSLIGGQEDDIAITLPTTITRRRSCGESD